MKIPVVDPAVTGSYKRTLNTALLIWVTGRAYRVASGTRSKGLPKLATAAVAIGALLSAIGWAVGLFM